MFALLFKQRITLYGYLLLLAILMAGCFLYPHPIIISLQEGYLFKPFHQLLPWVNQTIGCLTLLITAIIVNNTYTHEKFFENKTMIWGLAFVGLMGLAPQWFSFGPALPATLLWAWSLHDLLLAFGAKSNQARVFNMALKAALAYFLFQPAWVCAALLLLGLFIIGEFRFKILLTFTVGLLTPFYFIGAIAFINNQWETFINSCVMNLVWPTMPQTLALNLWLLIGFAATLTFLGLNTPKNSGMRSKAQTRTYATMYYVFALILAIVMLFSPFEMPGFGLLILPVWAMVVGKGWFNLSESWKADLLFLLWVATMLVPIFQ